MKRDPNPETGSANRGMPFHLLGTRPINRRHALCQLTFGAASLIRGASGLAEEVGSIPGPVTAVRSVHGRPQFVLDGRPYSKPVFETYVPETKYFRQFAEAGVDVFSFSTNLGDGFGTPTWLGPSEWNFSALDALAHRVLAVNPRGLLLPRIYCTTPQWWIGMHPEECQVLANGSRHYSRGVGHGRDGRAFPSLASLRWRTETAAALQQVIRHMQQSDYGDRMFGYMVTGLMSEEWYHWSIHTNELSDYSIHAQRAFQAWLQQKYQTTEALRSAWNDPSASFEAASVPSQKARQEGRGKRTFRDPSREMPVIDWYLFYSDLVAETIAQLCRAAKEASGERKVVGAFYCYMFEFGGDPEYGHNAMGRLLRCPHIDFIMVTASYHDRVLGRGADYARSPITSVALHGKLWYHDNDTASFRYDAIHAKNPDRNTVARYRRELGVTDNVQQSLWQYRRSAGFVLGHGVFQALFDLHGGYFDDPTLLAEVKALVALFARAHQDDCSSVAQILVVSDELSSAYATFDSGLLQQTLQPAQVQLVKLGAPHDSILVDDLALVDMDRYKLVVFLNCFHLDAEHRRLIRRRVLHSNRTVLWAYAPGLFEGNTRAVEAMCELIGIELAVSPDENPVRCRIALSPMGAELLQGAPGTAGGVIGHEHVWAQAISVVDRDAVPLGYLEGTQQIAFALKRLAGWTSVYTLNPVLPAVCLRALARQAAVHIFNDRSDTLYACRSYLCVNADGAGERTLRFPKAVDLVDPLTNKPLARSIKQFRHALQDKETLLVRVESAHAPHTHTSANACTATKPPT